MKLHNITFLILVALVYLLGCNSPYSQKKTGYFHIDFPQKEYQPFNEPGYPYTFEYPVYAKVTKDSSYFDSDNPYWINITFPQFDGKIYISYKDIGGRSTYKVKGTDGKYRDSTAQNDFYKMVNDAYNMSFKNDIKAYSIEDSIMQTPNGLGGVFFSLSGNVATAQQFFLSDTTKHFLRGALYFNVTPNEDSLMPVDRFLLADMKHIINSLKWK
ncbi:MAG TPA: hypothetical protein PLM81_01695 [Ginsengibacter sp.]|nr:hypothetical protein [Chitinophagales bacterium]HRN71811.1 hypothetical protein [Ginsengibacter sp.]HRP17656.1 hypothetical protein [Ginsengibacter sp.]HRP43645.1 hypothetical protein [Ginsengibacter sp.]